MNEWMNQSNEINQKVEHLRSLDRAFTLYIHKAKKKKVLDSQATFCKNRWGRQVFILFFISPQNKWGNFFFFTQSNLTLM